VGLAEEGPEVDDRDHRASEVYQTLDKAGHRD
jgi:hypothetical protein